MQNKGLDSVSFLSDSQLPVIDSPQQLRELPVDKLPLVCKELRKTIIEQLAVNPGHFASSMGAVELTVALHYVFDTPRDRLVWDVGHQAYAHKLLTGRRSRFSTNRTLGGLSGFPNPEESEYDTFTAGHASNSISAALGMAVASTLNADSPRRNVVAIIGDASISGGLAFEGLNNVANTPNNLLIILNDNEMSIDRNVGALTSYLGSINTTKRYNRMRYKTYKLLKRIGLLKDSHRGFIIRFNNSIKSLLNGQQNIFEGLNIRYFGPIDGNDVEKVVRVLKELKDMDGPKILHLRTVKGYGFSPAEADPTTWHAPGKFDPESGRRLETSLGMRNNPQKWQDIFGEKLVSMAMADKRIVGITAAMPTGTSINKMQARFPDRVFDVGISEGHAVTFAGGLAKEGLRPVVAIYSAFLQRAYDHIIHDVAIAHLPVTFCIDRAGLVGEDGATHHGAFDLAYLRSIPGIVIAAPSDAGSLRLMMDLALNHDGPMAIRYPRGAAPMSLPATKQLDLGRGRLLRKGSDVVVLSLGPITASVAMAVEKAEVADGVTAEHYDMMFLRPIDESILKRVAAKGVPVVTVEDGTVDGGLGSAVVEWLNDYGVSDIPVFRVGIPSDHFVTQGTVSQLHKLCGMDPDSIYHTIIKAADR